MKSRDNADAGISPFHTGEQTVQSRQGVRETIEPWAQQVIRPFLPEQHRDFFSQLPFVVAAARDDAGRPWATLLAGAPGFVSSPDDSTLQIATQPLPGDALYDSMDAGAELGLLGIELETRRRNRVNGTIIKDGIGGLTLKVSQAFGNCPQYITERSWRSVDVRKIDATASRHSKIDGEMRKWISAADTLFIASGYRGADSGSAAYGMDASHRGGNAGFVKVLGDRQLVFPDYAGNNHFNTIGNLVMDPRVGLLFVDFENGGMLQISGKATIDWDSAEVARHPGAQRLVIVDVEQVVRLDGVLPLRWSEPKGSVRSLRLARKIEESDDVTSFEFLARDHGDLQGFEAGQYLPIEFRIDGYDQSFKRTYSLSNGPGEGRYRISVKREPQGIVSRHLHDTLKEGEIVSSRIPDGEFVLKNNDRPVALVSAGIGVTPMVSMLHALARDTGDRPVLFIHGARDGAHHPLAGEIRGIAGRHENVRLEVAYSQPRVEDIKGKHYTRPGRVSAALIEELIPGLDADFYLCGPPGFLAEIAAFLNLRGVAPEYIHTETF